MGGAGVVGCGALAGAATNGVGYMTSDGPKTLSGFVGSVAMGLAVGAVSGAVGEAASGVVGRLLQNVGGKILQGAATGAAGAVDYGAICSKTEEGCSASGAARATAFGGAASKIGCHSFTSATPVLLASGAVKPISQIKAGDYVLTAEPGKKTMEVHNVTTAWGATRTRSRRTR